MEKVHTATKPRIGRNKGVKRAPLYARIGRKYSRNSPLSNFSVINKLTGKA